MGNNELRVISTNFDQNEEFPIKDSLIALDTSAIFRIVSPNPETKAFIYHLMINNNQLVIPYKAYEELMILSDSEPRPKPVTVTRSDRENMVSIACDEVNYNLKVVESTGMLYPEFLDLDPSTKIDVLDDLRTRAPLRYPDLTVLAVAIVNGIEYLWTYDSDYHVSPPGEITIITDDHILKKMIKNGALINKEP